MITANLMTRAQAEELWPVVWGHLTNPADQFGPGYEKLPGSWWWVVKDENKIVGMTWGRKWTLDGEVVSIGRGMLEDYLHTPQRQEYRAVAKEAMWRDLPQMETMICQAYSTNAYMVSVFIKHYPLIGYIPRREGGMYLFLLGRRKDRK